MLGGLVTRQRVSSRWRCPLCLLVVRCVVAGRLAQRVLLEVLLCLDRRCLDRRWMGCRWMGCR